MKPVTLVKDGRRATTDVPREVVALKAQGWTVDKPKAAKPDSK